MKYIIKVFLDINRIYVEYEMKGIFYVKKLSIDELIYFRRGSDDTFSLGYSICK